MARGIADRARYRQRIKSLISKPPTSSDGLGSELEVHAHWAKYTCVLISGFIEQSVKEIVLEFASVSAQPRIRSYIENTWPNSKNMRCEAIREILDCLDGGWASSFESWLDQNERKKEINETIKWRNDIAHGKESNTNNVTIASVKTKFLIACELVDFLDSLLQEAAAPA